MNRAIRIENTVGNITVNSLIGLWERRTNKKIGEERKEVGQVIIIHVGADGLSWGGWPKVELAQRLRSVGKHSTPETMARSHCILLASEQRCPTCPVIRPQQRLNLKSTSSPSTFNYKSILATLRTKNHLQQQFRQKKKPLKIHHYKNGMRAFCYIKAESANFS